jgi:hypothetical protein
MENNGRYGHNGVPGIGIRRAVLATTAQTGALFVENRLPGPLALNKEGK